MININLDRWTQRLEDYEKALMQLSAAVNLSKQRQLSYLEKIHNSNLLNHIKKVGIVFYAP